MSEPRRRSLSAIGTILVGSAIGQGAVLAVSPLLTRLYSPADFGLLAIVTAFAGVLGGILSLALESAVPLPRSRNQAASLAIVATAAIVLLGGVITALAWVLREWLADILNTPEIRSQWWLIPATAVTIAAFGVVSSILIRGRAYGSLAQRNAFQGLAQAAWSVGWGYVAPSGVALASGLGVGRAIGTLVGLRNALAGDWGTITFLRLRVVVIRYRRFPIFTTWSRLINSLGLQLPILIVAASYGSLQLGLFAITIRVLAAPVGIVADAAAQYFEGAFAIRIRDKQPLRRFVYGLSLQLLVAGSIPAGIVLLFGPELYEFAFGPGWGPAGHLAQVVVVTYVVQLAVSPVSRALNLLERQATQLVWDIGRVTLVALVLLIAAGRGAPIETALLALTFVQVIAYLVLFLLIVLSARRVESRWAHNVQLLS